MKPWTLALAATALVAVTSLTTRILLERPAPDDRAVRATLRSAALGEERDVVVALPESYAREPGRRYPVIYVLDGDSQRAHTADSAALLARVGAMPEAIVVSAPPVDGRGRQRDYTPPGMRQDSDVAEGPDGRADRFLAFLKDELIPWVEREYRVGRPRILAGNSRGGLFVVYSLLAGPSLFDARFALSPALFRDGDAIVTRLDTFLGSAPSLAGFLYLSLGEGENEKMKGAFRRAVAVLEKRAPPGLRWRADFSRGGTHDSNAHLSTPVGLYATFAAGRSDLAR